MRSSLRPAPSLSLVAGFLCVSMSTNLAAQGVRYSLAPAANYFDWDKGTGLENTTLYGGRLGLDFGTLAGLEGFYFTRSSIRTTLAGSSLPTGPGGPFSNQDTDLRNYGVDLVINLSPGRIVPFVKAGAGVFQLNPSQSADFSQVTYKYGGGLKMDFTPSLRGVVYVEDARFRLDRYALVPGGRPAGVPADPQANKSRSNLSIGAGLGFALGGNKFDRGTAPREKWSLASFPIEPFAGRMNFDDHSLVDQDLAGIRAGINVGNYFAIKGYYWRGVGSFFNDTDPIESYGAEAQFDFTSNAGPVPFLVLGAGNLDFKPGYRSRTGITPADRTVLLAGGGLGIRLTDQFRLNAGVRDYIYSQSGIDSVGSTTDLRHNVLFTAGLSFSIGRNRDRLVTRHNDRDTVRLVESHGNARGIAKEEPDSSKQNVMKEESDSSKQYVTKEDVTAAKEPSGSNLSTRSVTIPMPASGELYVRYGEPSDISARHNPGPGAVFPGAQSSISAADMALLREEIRTVVQDELRRSNRSQAPFSRADTMAMTEPASRATMRDEIRRMMDDEFAARRVPDSPRANFQAAAPSQPNASSEQLSMGNRQAVEDRLVVRMDSLITARMRSDNRSSDDLRRMEDRLNERIDKALTDRPAVSAVQPQTVVVTPGVTGPRPVVRDSTGRVVGAPGFSVLQPSVYTGIGFNDPAQLLIGGRVDLTPYVNWGSFSLVPEFSFGLLNGTSVMIAANIQYSPPTFVVSNRDITPVVRLGLGIFRFSDNNKSSTEGTLNVTYGVSTPLGGPTLTGQRRFLFVEHQGLDLFNFNRLLVGVQWRY
ncbi:MAG: outer membrane beta-barrel protein [Gemmatimonadota bacterium]